MERRFSERTMEVGGIEKVTLESVFLEWIERLRRFIDADGKQVD
jgi:hypothetical protein